MGGPNLSTSVYAIRVLGEQPDVFCFLQSGRTPMPLLTDGSTSLGKKVNMIGEENLWKDWIEKNMQ